MFPIILQNSVRQKSRLFPSIFRSQYLFSTVATNSTPTTTTSDPIASTTPAPLSSKRTQIPLTLRGGMGSKDSQKLRNGKKLFNLILFVNTLLLLLLFNHMCIYKYIEQGLVPGVIYGTDGKGRVVKVMVAADRLLLEREMRRRGAALENTVYDVSLPNGTSFTVVPRQLQLNPCKCLLPHIYIHTFVAQFSLYFFFFNHSYAPLFFFYLNGKFYHQYQFNSDGPTSERKFPRISSRYASQHPYRIHKHRGLCRLEERRASYHRKCGNRVCMRWRSPTEDLCRYE